MDTIKPLTPLTNGSVLIIGVKASNMSDDLRAHPRVILWESENQNWIKRDVPDNVKAIFFTRFNGHTNFDRIRTDARNRHITLFNVKGTGMIMKQVKELLDITPKLPITPSDGPKEKKVYGAVKKLIPFINFSLTNTENAEVLMAKAEELGVKTTRAYLHQFVGVQRRKTLGTAVPKSIQSKLDVTVQMLDGMIQELGDMRDFLIATCEENRLLKSKLDKFKTVMESE